jgi:hypothetical protein
VGKPPVHAMTSGKGRFLDITRRQLGRLAAVDAGAFVLPGLLPPSRAAATVPPVGTWGDQGDGTYVNPILPGDFSDWDGIRIAHGGRRDGVRPPRTGGPRRRSARRAVPLRRRLRRVGRPALRDHHHGRAQRRRHADLRSGDHAERCGLRTPWDTLDGNVFSSCGGTYQLAWGGYRGDRVDLCTYHPNDTGCVDVDSVQYTIPPTGVCPVRQRAQRQGARRNGVLDGGRRGGRADDRRRPDEPPLAAAPADRGRVRPGQPQQRQGARRQGRQYGRPCHADPVPRRRQLQIALSSSKGARCLPPSADDGCCK